MARVRIKDLPEDSRVSDAEAKNAFGGAMAAMSLESGPMMRSGGNLQAHPGAGGLHKPSQNMIQIATVPGRGKVPGQSAMPNCTDTCW